ncbi:MAG: response regulator transcription factor [Phaeodactylibacter sp.]|nr:response regulator transcription factor [Phaeodactylibacter sp.]
MKAFIIEDEYASREILKEFIKTYCPQLEIVGEAARIQEALPGIQAQRPELLFLDIELPEENGFALFQYIDPSDYAIIFTTAYDEYAVRAFRLSAVDYLLKPIDVEELKKAVAKAQNFVQPERQGQHQALLANYRGNDPKLGLVTKNGFVFIRILEILKLDADGKYTTFYLSNGERYMTSKNLGEYELLLEPYRFFRIHRSSMINLNKVQQYIKSKSPVVILEDGSSANVSQSRRDLLLEALGI